MTSPKSWVALPAAGVVLVSMVTFAPDATSGAFTFRAEPLSGPAGQEVAVFSTEPCVPASTALTPVVEVAVTRGEEAYRGGHFAIDRSGRWGGTITISDEADPGPAAITAECFASDDDVEDEEAAYAVYVPVTFVVQEENRPPNCSTVRPIPSTLFPANHGLSSVGLAGATDPDGDRVTTTITGVSQDEPLDGDGDGDTSPDALPAATPDSVQLRAERSGGGDGRVYRIGFLVDDGRDGTCTGVVVVGVPHDRGPKGVAVDSGAEVDSFG
jgi:hypothetical protein